MRLISFLLLCAFVSWSHAQTYVEISGTGTVMTVNPDHVGLFSVNDTITARIVYAVPASGFDTRSMKIAGLAFKFEVNGNVIEMSSPLKFTDTSLSKAGLFTSSTGTPQAFLLSLRQDAGNTYSLPPGISALGIVDFMLQSNALYISEKFPEQTSDLNLGNTLFNRIALPSIAGGDASIFELNPSSIQLKTVSTFPGLAPASAPQPKAVPGSTWWSAMLMMIGLGFIGRKRLAGLLP